MGKTSIATVLAHDADLLTRYPDGVLWASLGEAPNVLAEIAGWGRHLGNETLSQAANIREAITGLRRFLAKRRYLLVLDDLWDPTHVAPFYDVCSSACALLLTTRDTGLANHLVTRQNEVYTLPVLDEDSAFELLEVLAPEVAQASPGLCRDMVKDLGRLPLALHVAGRLLRSESSKGWGIEQLAEEIRHGAVLLEAPAPLDRTDVLRGTTPSVAALLERSTARLDETTRAIFSINVLPTIPA